MCTAICYNSFFGRNLDVEQGYNEQSVITPRNFKLDFRFVDTITNHFAIIGIATVIDNYPLYFDACNEKGICIAGLNFPEFCVYHKYCYGKTNLTPFEFIPWLLSHFDSLEKIKSALEKVNIINDPFNNELALTPLHWIVSDGKKSITVESVTGGLQVYDNSIGVLTNSPTFNVHKKNLEKISGLDNGTPNNAYSLGMNAVGLPGDFSSESRFLRAAFVKKFSPCFETERENVRQFFSILNSVAMPKGCVLTKNGDAEYTRYSTSYNTKTGRCYFVFENNTALEHVDLFDYDLQKSSLFRKDLNTLSKI